LRFIANKIYLFLFLKIGGIDGVICEDKIALDQRYIQAKKYFEKSLGSLTFQIFKGTKTGGAPAWHAGGQRSNPLGSIESLIIK